MATTYARPPLPDIRRSSPDFLPSKSPAASVSKTFGDFMQGVAHRKAAMNTQVGGQGGYLVPKELTVGIDQCLQEYSVFHKLAFQQEMKSTTLDVAGLDLTAAHAAGVSPMFGGLSLAWESTEGTTVPETEPSFTAIGLVSRQLRGRLVASNQLVDDGGEALGKYLEQAFAKAMVNGVERGCLVGTGAPMLRGIVGAPGTAVTARAVAAQVRQADLAKMMRTLLPACYVGSIWMVSVTALEQIESLVVYQINQPQPSAFCGMLFGRPVYATEHLPALGTQGDVVLFDPRLYVLGTRNIEVAASKEVPGNFEKNQTVYRIIWRGDGQPMVRNTLTLADNTTTAACYVALGA